MATERADAQAVERALTLVPLRSTALLRELLQVLAKNGWQEPPGQYSALLHTPERWWRAIAEMTTGYGIDTQQLLTTQFDEVPSDELIVLADVPFASLCEHHLLPFTGHACVGYLPDGSKRRVVGLSKLARLIDAHARRLQVQERMTHDIANDLMQYVAPLGAACIVEATHSCMSCRGVNKSGTMVTSSLLGQCRDATVRSEFLRLIRR